MYILTIGRSYPQKKTGMRGIFEFEQARAIKNAGHKSVYAFCDSRSIKVLRAYGNVKLSEQNVNVYGFQIPNIGYPRYVFSIMKKYYFMRILKKVLETEGIPDAIHVHFPLITLTDGIWEMLKELNRPIIVTEHWTRVQTKKIEDYRRKFLQRVVNESNEFICVGEPLKLSVLELTKSNRNINVIPNMVSPLFFYDKQNTNLNSTDFEFVTIGRLVEVKGFDTVISAFAKVFKGNNNVKLKIVGDGSLYDKLQLQIENLGMEQQISMLGFLTREDTAREVSLSDAYVSGSKLETFGVPFIEAMASGLPVIGMIGSPIDKYINTNNGVQFQVDNSESLSEAMYYVYKNKSKYEKREISKYAENIFSEKAIVEMLIVIYQRHIKG